MGTIRAVILQLSIFCIYKIYAGSTSNTSENTIDQNARPFVSICLCSSNADPARAEEWFQSRTIYTDPCTSCYYACLMRQMKLTYLNDTYNLDAWFEQLGGMVPMGDLIACNATHGPNPDPCQRASGFSQCVEDVLNRDPIAERPSL